MESNGNNNKRSLSDEEIAEAFQVCQEMVERVVSNAIAKIAENEDIPMEFPSCSICLGEMNITDDSCTTLPCGHQFHKECVGAWMKQVRKTTCPLCRQKVSPKVRQVLRRDAPKPPPKKQARK